MEDVKTLASQALIAKSQSGNITAGGITDPDTITALDFMNDSAQGIVEQAESETETLLEFLTTAYDDVLACNVPVQSFPTSYETNHDDCRGILTGLYENFSAAEGFYKTAVTQVRGDTPDCVTKFVSDCSAWDAEFFHLSNSADLKTLSLRKAVLCATAKKTCVDFCVQPEFFWIKLKLIARHVKKWSFSSHRMSSLSSFSQVLS